LQLQMGSSMKSLKWQLNYADMEQDLQFIKFSMFHKFTGLKD
jgi:hypothetical protein